MRYLDDLRFAHPWLTGMVGALILFAMMSRTMPLWAAAACSVAVFGVTSWSWRRGPSQQSYLQRLATERRETALASERGFWSNLRNEFAILFEGFGLKLWHKIAIAFFLAIPVLLLGKELMR